MTNTKNNTIEKTEQPIKKLIVEACPAECIFDWADFHDKLDTAVAHMITESKIMPSKTSITSLLSFSNTKTHIHKNHPEKRK